jgi:Mor family transcriptional regulator
VSEPRPYRYSGKNHRASELASRLVEIGQAKLQAEGMPAEAALLVMRAITSELCDEYGGQQLYMPIELAWDGLTERDRQIWAAYTGHNIPELCKRFGMCDRQVYYVIDYARRWHKGHSQPELPGLEQPQQAAA